MKQQFARYSNILYLYFSEGFLKLPESAKNNASPKSSLKRVLKVAGYAVVRLLGNLFQSVEKPAELQRKVWLYVVSQNNYDSLSFIAEALPHAVLVAGQNKSIGKYANDVKRISLRKKIIYYYKFLPLLFQFLKQKKHITLRFYDLLFDAIGFYEVYLQKLRKYRPTCVVFANDHNPDARAMLLAAKKLGIKTAYIQHASVSNLFPPLMFDLNLLEGHDSLDKYKLCGPIAGKVELIGMPKADKYVPLRNHNTSIKTVGIGSNLMDLIEELERLLVQLSAAFPTLQFILRPHPRDNRDFSFLKSIGSNISLSDSRTAPTFEYLSQIDLQVSGNSGIHLEAVLLNVWSIFYNFNPKENLQDYYGYVANGLVDTASNTASLADLLRQHLHNKPKVYHRAKYYNATVGTHYDGHSSELALQKLQQFIASN
ncbi:hypothetical protein [Pontibacter harenae]|uniref:hypothetical protein n=1 Tax=Pontibacter harenae TaxID=2894083 RepID=UPI001E49E9A5|nr:hypothetical protein [Pontibacter harenae]MCC9167265.1 hypothetical protein [Pontibacter harenae]